jgi:hypothetical protein
MFEWAGIAQSVLRLATGWTVRGSNPGAGEIFHTCPDRLWGPPSLLYNGYRVFPGGKERPGRDAEPSPLLVPWSRKGRAITLLPLWAVRIVQNLTACTRVHFNIYLTSYVTGSDRESKRGCHSWLLIYNIKVTHVTYLRRR